MTGTGCLWMYNASLRLVILITVDTARVAAPLWALVLTGLKGTSRELRRLPTPSYAPEARLREFRRSAE